MTQPQGAAARIADLRAEHRRDAQGIGTGRPRLSWRVETARPGWQQAAYAVEVSGLDGQRHGQTGRVVGSESVLVAWPFAPLQSRERVALRVRVWGTDGDPSPWSAAHPVEVGLLEATDWRARFVTPDWDGTSQAARPSPLLRHEFDVRPGVAYARLYATALGVYEARLNGQVVGDHVLDPGWTSYPHRLRYQTFDVTHLVREGRNTLGAMLGDGWYRGRLGWKGGQSLYGDRLAWLAQLEVHYADGSVDTVVTDETWRAASGPILASDIYDGETYDARLERPGWAEPGYADGDWAGVRVVARDPTTLVAPSGPPVRRTELLAPLSISRSPSGKTIVDFGQNLVGRLRLTVQGEAGQTVTLRHAEVLEDGELCVRPLRTAKATDYYTLRGGAAETWEPRFTFHGFRYAEIDGWPGELRLDDLRAVVCHSDMERAGWFECSDPLLNRLHQNAVWSMRGNFLDLPTDCPQRDERLGWTGDIQVFTPTATFLYHAAGFLQSWLADLAAEQAVAGGSVPFVVPNVLHDGATARAAWGDAAVIVPWTLYERYGDVGLLAAQYASMRAWVDHLAGLAGESRLWDEGFQFGDWLDPSAPPHQPWAARTPMRVVATAYFAHSANLLARAARVLGHVEDAARYAALAAEVRAAFVAAYVSPEGIVEGDGQTGYALALQFGLLPDAARRAAAARRLLELVRENGYRIGTGFVGTPLIADALCGTGHQDAAFHLVMQTQCPSWLYPVTMGATTIWERWDSLLPDGRVNPGEMTSFNHYALGAVADWLHRVVGGLAPAAPGYRHLAIRPRPGGGLTYAEARHVTPYGPAACRWRITGESIEVQAVVPPNTTATVTLPGRDAEPLEVGSGAHTWTYRWAATSDQ